MLIDHPIWGYLAAFLLFAALLTFILSFTRTYRIKPFSTSNSIKLLALAALALAISKPKIERIHEYARIFALVDISESMDQNQAEKLLTKLKELAANKTEVQVIPFAGKSADFPTRLSDISSYAKLKSAWGALDQGHSNLRSALDRLGSAELLANLKDSTLSSTETLQQKAAVIISDGQQNQGDALELAEQIKISGTRLYPLVPEIGQDQTASFKIAKMNAPLLAAAESSVDVRITVANSSDKSEEGRLVVKQAGKVLYDKVLSLKPSQETLLVVESDRTAIGISEIEATLFPSNSALAQSSERVYLSSQEREKVLLLSGNAEDEQLLKQALEAQAYKLNALNSSAVKSASIEFEQYSLVILNNIALEQLASGSADKLESYINDGGSALMIGGNKSLGLGGYKNTPIERALPLEFIDPHTEKKRLNVAVVLVLDKSRSMAEGNKLDFAKEAARGVVDALKDEDYLSIIGFDRLPFVALKIGLLRDIRSMAYERISRLIAAESTNLLPALDEARLAISRAQAGRRHVIILTDGKLPNAGAFYREKVSELRTLGATISTVMVGAAEDSELKAIAELGGGAFYQTTDATSLPKIFLGDLKVASGERTLKEASDYQVRQAPAALDITKISAFPELKGYVQSRAKATASLELVVYADSRAEPLLAFWGYGKGKSAVFTSDANGRWSSYWTRWSKFQPFWNSVINNLRPKGEDNADSNKDPNKVRFDLRTYLEGGALQLDLSIFDQSYAGNVEGALKLPDGRTISPNFVSSKKGRYLAKIDSAMAGKYELKLKANAKALAPVAFHLSGELFGERKGEGFNRALLSKLANSSYGQINPDAAELLQRKERRVEFTELSWLFYLSALILFFLSIVAREFSWLRR